MRIRLSPIVAVPFFHRLVLHDSSLYRRREWILFLGVRFVSRRYYKLTSIHGRICGQNGLLLGAKSVFNSRQKWPSIWCKVLYFNCGFHASKLSNNCENITVKLIFSRMNLETLWLTLKSFRIYLNRNPMSKTWFHLIFSQKTFLPLSSFKTCSKL